MSLTYRKTTVSGLLWALGGFEIDTGPEGRRFQGRPTMGAKIEEIRKLRAQGLSIAKIAARIGNTPGSVNVFMCLNGLSNTQWRRCSPYKKDRDLWEKLRRIWLSPQFALNADAVEAMNELCGPGIWTLSTAPNHFGPSGRGGTKRAWIPLPLSTPVADAGVNHVVRR